MSTSKLLKSVVDSVQTKYGKESISLMNANPLKKQRLSSQAANLDLILGGGLPYGSIVEILGDEGSGKTTLALHILAECQAKKGIAVIVDAEHALDFSYAKEIGVDPDNLILSQPNNGNEAMEIACHIMREKINMAKDIPLVIVLDSIAALATEVELSGEITDIKVSPLARFMSDILRRITSIIAESKAIFICLNQLRVDIGTYGNPNKSTGGRALKYYANVRLQLTPSKKIIEKGEVEGQTIKIKTVKNKTYIPFQETDIRIIFGKGIDKAYSLFNAGVEKGLFAKKGSWFEYRDSKYQGEKGFIEEIRENVILAKKIEKDLYNVQK